MEDFLHGKATEHMQIAWVTIGMMYRDPDDAFIGHEGIEVVRVDFDERHHGAIFIFPTPERLTEAFMTAIVVPRDLAVEDEGRSQYITLEYSPDRPNKTFVGGWGDGIHFNFGAGAEPTVDNFRQVIVDHIRPRAGRVNRMVFDPPRKRRKPENRSRDFSEWDDE